MKIVLGAMMYLPGPASVMKNLLPSSGSITRRHLLGVSLWGRLLRKTSSTKVMSPFRDNPYPRAHQPGLHSPGLLAPTWVNFERPSRPQCTPWAWLRTVGTISQPSSSVQSHFLFLLPLALVSRALPYMLICLKVYFTENPVYNTDDEVFTKCLI